MASEEYTAQYHSVYDTLLKNYFESGEFEKQIDASGINMQDMGSPGKNFNFKGPDNKTENADAASAKQQVMVLRSMPHSGRGKMFV